MRISRPLPKVLLCQSYHCMSMHKITARSLSLFQEYQNIFPNSTNLKQLTETEHIKICCMYMPVELLTLEHITTTELPC